MADPSLSQDHLLGALPDGTQLVACGVPTSRLLIARRDPYVNNQSQFDRQARFGAPQDAALVTEEMFLGYLTAQVVGWTEAEVASLKAILEESLTPTFETIGLTLPPKIYLIKTTGREEGAAAYTRGLDVIALPANMVASLVEIPPGGDSLHPGSSTAYLAGIVTHEFFHILSKNNPEARRNLYGELGYVQFDSPVRLPEVVMPSGARLPDLKITNPDAPLLDVYIELAPPDGGAPVPMVPILYSSAPYTGGTFFQTLIWDFMVIEQGPDCWRPVLKEGRPVLIPNAEVLDAYKRKVGTNFSDEIFHPDEILAQSFVVAAQYPELNRLAGIRSGIWTG